MNTKLILTLIITSLIMLYSCGGDDDSPAQMSIDFNFNVDGEALTFGEVYEINGTAVSFDAANFYVGGLEITQEDGSIVTLSDHILAGVNRGITIQGDFEQSDITEMSFYIGVDPETNAQTEMDFTSRPANDPLGIQDPSMHWNWNTGYKFLRVDGDADTDGDGVPDTGIAYHIGSDAFLLERTITDKIEIKGGANTIEFALDLNEFFTGVDLATEIDTHTGNNLPLANRLKTNMSTAITVK